MTKVTLLKSHLSGCGGLEKYTRRLAQAFVAKGCEVFILSDSDPKKELECSSAYTIVQLPVTSKIGFRRLWQFDRLCELWIQNNKPDVVFGMGRNTFQTHYRAGNGVHAAFLERRAKNDSFLKRLSFRFNPLHRSILNIERSAYENPELKTLFTNSHMVKEELTKHYRIDPSKIQVVHNGVEWEEMSQPFAEWPEKRNDILNRLGLDRAAFQFLFIGKGFRRKGLPYLLQAHSQLTDRNWQLSVVGDDKEMKTFQRMATSLGLQNRVKFFGHQKNVIPFYQACDALVIPSTYDPFANVTVEALAMGLFVVSSKSNGGSEILTPETGLIIEDLYRQNTFLDALKEAFKHPKNVTGANAIRQSVKSLDFSQQLNHIVAATLQSI